MKENWKKYLPKGIPLVLAALAWNQIVYTGTKFIAGGWVHHNMESAWDLMLPFVPEMVTIYLGCYAFWGVNYFLGACQEERERYRLLSADILGKAVCLVIFLVFPTTNVRPELTGANIWEAVMGFVYSIDAADNLFPSIHCFNSWIAYRAVRKNSLAPKWYRVVSLIIVAAVCVSTLLTKQHVIIDTIGGVLLAELCYQVTERIGFAQWYGRMWTKLFERLDRKMSMSAR